MLEYWYIFPVAITISSAASSVGIGGGVLLMPFFLIVLKLSPEIAVVTSLMTQMAGMGSASFTCFKQKRIDFKLARLILLIAFPGIYVGASLANFLESRDMELILGMMVMITAFVFVSSDQKYNDLGQDKVDMSKAYRHAWITFPAAIASGMLSVSLSEWLIPVMRSKLSLSMSHAIGTCLFIAFCVSVFGVLTHSFMGGSPDYSIVVWTIPGVLIGGQIGPRVTKRINERLLKEAFIFLLTLVGIHLVYNAF